MGLILESTFIEVLSALGILIWTLYMYVQDKYSFWKDRNVPYIKPTFPFGSMKDMLMGKISMSQAYDKCYQEFKDEKYFGVYEGRKPVLVLKDPELIRHILIKDFSHFTNRSVFTIDAKKDYINKHLFNLTGNEWKKMRLTLAPTFTSGKMKMMFHLMLQCTKQLREFLNEQVKAGVEVDVKDVLARFTMDIIATCAFGLETNSQTDQDCEFYKVGMEIFTPSTKTVLRRFLLLAFPFITKIYVPRFLPKHIQDFLTNIVKDAVNFRGKNNIVRNDFLDLLIKIRQNKSLTEEDESANGHSESKQKNNSDKAEMTIEQMVAQAFIFFAAGFETASSTMAFCLYELAKNKEIQDKLHKEVQEVLEKHEGNITYQAMQEMVYMDQVVNETLRLYASLGILNRTCSKPYQLPNSDLVLQEEQKLVIPTYAIHHDPKYYPQPEKFDPERFSPERVKERHPCLHLPFGDGPRNCIGMRFGFLQTKIGLTEMLSNFEFNVSPNTQIPIKLHKTSFVTQPEKPIFLAISRRTE